MMRSFVGFFVFFIGIWHGGFSQTSLEEGANLLQKGELKQARNVFLEHQELEMAQEYLGDIASFNKNWDEAVEYYKKLVQNFPQNADYHFKLGGALGFKALESSQLEAVWLVRDIKKYLVRASELDPNHEQARRALVEFYIQLPSVIGGSKETALRYARELKDINELDAFLAHAYIYKSEGELEKSKAEILKALEAAAQNPNLFTRNYLYYELGEKATAFQLQPEIASEFLERYIENYGYRDLKSPAWAYYHLAKLKAVQNNKAAALQNINRALAHKFNFPEAEKEKQRILEM